MSNYPNPAKLLQAWLPTVLDTGDRRPVRRWLTSTPSDLRGGAMPIVVITRYGGGDSIVGLDDCNIDCNVFATGPDPMQAEEIALDRAEDIRRVVGRSLTGVTLGGVAAVSRVRTVSAPTIRPYDSKNQIRRAHYAFQMRLHVFF